MARRAFEPERSAHAARQRHHDGEPKAGTGGNADAFEAPKGFAGCRAFGGRKPEPKKAPLPLYDGLLVGFFHKMYGSVVKPIFSQTSMIRE